MAKDKTHITVEIDNELYAKFQKLLIKKYGRTYGHKQHEFRKAILSWINHENKRFGVKND